MIDIIGVHRLLAAGTFNPEDRGQGLGHEAVELLLASLKGSKAASMIQLEVAKSSCDRYISLNDWASKSVSARKITL